MVTICQGCKHLDGNLSFQLLKKKKDLFGPLHDWRCKFESICLWCLTRSSTDWRCRIPRSQYACHLWFKVFLTCFVIRAALGSPLICEYLTLGHIWNPKIWVPLQIVHHLGFSFDHCIWQPVQGIHCFVYNRPATRLQVMNQVQHSHLCSGTLEHKNKAFIQIFYIHRTYLLHEKVSDRIGRVETWVQNEVVSLS